MIIYKATNIINNKVYIGQTMHSLSNRKSQHINGYGRGSHYRFPKAIKKYGKENFKWEIIYTAKNLDDLNEKEIYFINLYDSTNPNKGYNIKSGGKNKPLPKSIKDKIGNAQKGELNHMYGKTGELNPTSKKVKNITTGEVFGSAMECARKLGLNNSHVSAVCRGDRGSTNKMVFRYLDENGNIIEPKGKAQQKNKRVMNLDTGEIFESIAEAEKKYVKGKSGNISKVCNGIYKVCGGYRWKYVD